MDSSELPSDLAPINGSFHTRKSSKKKRIRRKQTKRNLVGYGKQKRVSLNVTLPRKRRAAKKQKPKKTVKKPLRKKPSKSKVRKSK